MTTEKFLATEPGVAPGITPAFVKSLDAVVRRALGTIPENTLSQRTVLTADADNVEDETDRDNE